MVLDIRFHSCCFMSCLRVLCLNPISVVLYCIVLKGLARPNDVCKDDGPVHCLFADHCFFE